ncbi:MAG: cysteine desulfurase family protein [Dehalogenimonas sp.]
MASDNYIYLDNAASTITDERVIESMLPYYRECWANPSAAHPLGRAAREAIERAREQVATLIGCEAGEIIFTSGGTEADNLAIIGVARANTSRGRHIITSEIEHHAVLEACRRLEREGFVVTYLPVDRFGQVSAESVTQAIRPDTILVSIMSANNVVGTIQPIFEIGYICRKKEICFHTDAVQFASQLPIEVEKSQIDLLSLSAHKFYGPKGIGALYASRRVALDPIILGGGQEDGLRSGTENVPGIVGMGTAAEILTREMGETFIKLRKLQTKLLKGILESLRGVQLNGHPEYRLPNNLNISIEGIEGEYLAGELGKQGICVSTGSACSSASHEAPYVLLSMGIKRELANSSIRFSLGKHTTDNEIERTVAGLKQVVDQIRSQCEAYS